MLNVESNELECLNHLWLIFHTRDCRNEYSPLPTLEFGVDYFGPYEVKFMPKTMKRWCCLFTCLTTRAVHIEVVLSLEAETCLTAITRFIAGRGKPATILSDNGTNFVGAAKEMKDCINAWNQSDIETSLAQKDIKWKFNPPGAPHFGGIWERLVQSCKKSNDSCVGWTILDGRRPYNNYVFSRADVERNSTD